MAQADAIPTISRRGFLAVAAAPTAILAPNIASAKTPVSALSEAFEAAWLDQKNHEIRDFSIDTPESSAKFDRLYKKVLGLVERIERLPATDLQSLRLKARAVLWCHGGEEISLIDNPTTDVRLAQSIINNLLHLPNI